ncbi:MAG TPA: imidazole glycerol phosphate synthase subunit HisH [Saprospiraceae bacterium]|nr:imidazole glycerol phosphate synthase subunit HisH [Saprospiraceae bacterium]
MNKTVVIKYPAGNIQSVLHALDRLGTSAVWTDDPKEIRSASRVIFPGVGEASTAMAYLRHSGLDEVILGLQQPVLGICLGLQLFCRHSAENDTACLGIFDVPVLKFEAKGLYKVPHMGWNTLEATHGPLFHGIPPESYVYFVHSYYAVRSEYTSATTPYTLPFSAALQRENFFAVQFHPEKSGKIGQQILHNFLNIK